MTIPAYPTKNKKLRSLMVLGTASHVGKSLIVAALCRILNDDGLSVAPFKAQNMALNSAATPDGLEIGRAQAMQAEAARIAPTVDMNPVLIKPSSDTGAQVVVRGRVWGQVTASDYHRRRVEELFPLVVESYQRLASAHDIVVLEGAGSPAEINLKARDIVNMRMAQAADARCVLVGDIDRGGVFASLLGTLELLEIEERQRIHGFIINKFRGDESLLAPGVRMIEERIEKPCVGVIHHMADVGLDEEDSVANENLKTAAQVWREVETSPARALRVGVVALPFISNFTDFAALAAEPSVSLAYITKPHEIAFCDLVIIPGTKQTIDDLRWLHRERLTQAILEHARADKLIIGVCGGMQMLGHAVRDTAGREGGGSEDGLGLLPIRTTLAAEKVTRRARARLLAGNLFGQTLIGSETSGYEIHGYEIHLGTTEYDAAAAPLMQVTREDMTVGTTANESTFNIPDGATSRNNRTIGTYLHGFFDDDNFRHALLSRARLASNLNPATDFTLFTGERDNRFNRLAAHVRSALDMSQIYRWLNL